jgi:hypothetical protein
MSLLSLSFLALALTGAATAPEPPAPAAPAPFSVTAFPTSSTGGGQQFLAADAKGRLFLLHADTLEVYPVGDDGVLGEPQPLLAKGHGGLQSPVPICGAAMSPAGDWAIKEGFTRIRLFRDGKEETVSNPKFMIFGLTMLGGQPVIAGFPGDAVEGQDLPAEPPWLQVWNGKKWEPLATFANPERRVGRFASLPETQAAWLASTKEGRLWAAYAYRQKFVELSPAGRKLTEIEAGKGELRRLPNAAALERAAAAEAERLTTRTSKVSVAQVTAEVAVADLTVGRDGRVYFLVRAAGGNGGGLALERFDSIALQLEKLDLPIELPGMGATMAAGREGLWIASTAPKSGMWRLLWEDLDAAAWKRVEGTTVQGIPTEADEQPDSSISSRRKKPADTSRQLDSAATPSVEKIATQP